MHIKIIGILFVTLTLLSSNIFAEESTSTEEEATPELQSGNGWQVIRTVKMGRTNDVYLVLVEQKRYTDKTIYSAAIKHLCKKDMEFCRIRFWSELRYIPEKLKLTAYQYKQLKAEYIDNRKSGTRKLVWSCSVDPDKTHCLDL